MTDHSRIQAAGRAAACTFLLAACHPQHYRISVTPSLRPVDAARPMVVFSQTQGQACGLDAVLGAIRDLKRFDKVDGYLEVVVEETGEGHERCAKVTAYPFRYCVTIDPPVLRPGEESTAPQRIPGRNDANRDPCAPTDCEAACTRVAELVESGLINRALIRDRCIQRCNLPTEGTFTQCVQHASDAPGAAACLALPAAAAPPPEGI